MKLRTPLVVALLGASVLAHAQPAGDKTDAKALMQSGVKLLDAKDYLGALAVFRDAYARFPSSKILLNIGTTLKLLKRDADAANVYQRYLDAADADPKRVPEVKRILADIDRAVGTLAITATPADAEVQIGDEWLHGAALAAVRVAPGSIVLHARAPKHKDLERAVTAAAGAKQVVALALDAIPDPVVAPPAPVIVTPVEPHDELHASVAEPYARGRVGAFARAHVDALHAGAAGIVGATIATVAGLDVQVGAILGPTFGGYAGASYAFLTGAYRPYVAAGAPIFVSHGARVALRGAAGLEVFVHRHAALTIEAGVEDLLNREMTVKSRLAFVPAIGIVVR